MEERKKRDRRKCKKLDLKVHPSLLALHLVGYFVNNVSLLLNLFPGLVMDQS